VPINTARRALEHLGLRAKSAPLWRLAHLKKPCAQLRLPFPWEPNATHRLDSAIARAAVRGAVSVDSLLYTCLTHFLQEEARVCECLHREYIARTRVPTPPPPPREAVMRSMEGGVLVVLSYLCDVVCE
jgi:hypothetical protein